MQQQVIELPNFFNRKADKRFVFNDTGLLMMNDARPERIVEIPIVDIQSFRYGINWIKGYIIAIGRQYVIEIKDHDDKVVAIKFYSYYGFRRKQYNKAYQQLIQAMWDHYFLQHAQHYLNLYQLNLAFEIAGVIIANTGISWNKKVNIGWGKLVISNYTTYFVLHHADNYRIQKGFNFLKDWNALLLQSLLLHLKKQQ